MTASARDNAISGTEARTWRRRGRLLPLLGLAGAALIAGGCANQTTSYRTERFGPNGPVIVSTDAQLRHTIMVPDPARANQWRACAEAAPDVFSAISASAAADGSYTSDGTDRAARLRGALAIAQTAATIERTQTINLLRESMFRTCERYLSGGIDQAVLVVQAGRDWRAMIAILAIDQLTRSARPPSTVISAAATSAGLQNNDEATAGLLAAQGRLEAGRTAQATAATTACPAPAAPATTPTTPTTTTPTTPTTTTPTTPTTTTPTTPTTTTPTTPATTPATTATTPAPAAATCPAKQAAVDAANATVRDATSDIATYRAAIAASGRTGAGTEAGTTSTGQGGGAISDTALQHVAPVVQHIVDQAFQTDETQLFCLQSLSRNNSLTGLDDNLPGSGLSVRQLCVQYLAARVQSDIRALSTWQVSAVANDNMNAQINAIATYLGRQPGTPAVRWNQLVAQIQPLFPFTPLNVPEEATIEQIKDKMRENAGTLQTLVNRIQQGGQ